jgi:predicted porin
MKKSLIALAIASAVSAPAFAATSNVDIYGVLNVDINRVDNDVTGEDSSTNVSSNASRIGFKGSEDLGGGLKAIWQIESGFNADEVSGTLGSRNTFVGLSGGWGTVLAGKHDTPMKLLGRKVDNFGDIMADDRNIIGAGADSGTSLFDLRTPNTIAYISPNFSGLTVIGAYVTDHGKGAGAATCDAGLDCNKDDAYSVSADYANGPFMLGAAYEKHNVDTISRKMWRVVGGFKFGDAKLGALYEKGSAPTGSALEEADRKAWGLFANYAIGAITLKANYLKAGDYADVADSGAKQYTVGADYALSKRSTAFAYYAKIKNDTAAAFDLGRAQGVSDSTTTVGGADPSVFGIGMKHTF